jgi:DNA-damage-inducible protein D
MVSLGSGSIREVTDYMLSKFACKLICMNGDPNQKPIIGIAQSYFAIVTNNLEDMIDTYKYSERLEPVTEAKEQTKQFNSALYSHGVNTSKGIASIKSKGDEAFFGGYNTQDMKEKLGIPKSSSLNDCLDSLPLSFKNAAMQLSKRQIIDNNFRGENTITNLHMNNNSTMRDVMINNGYYPEDFPAEENFKKLEKRLGKIPDINPEELIILTNTITGEKVIIKNPFIKIK